MEVVPKQLLEWKVVLTVEVLIQSLFTYNSLIGVHVGNRYVGRKGSDCDKEGGLHPKHLTYWLLLTEVEPFSFFPECLVMNYLLFRNVQNEQQDEQLFVSYAPGLEARYALNPSL